MSTQTINRPSLLVRFLRALGFGIPLDPPKAFEGAVQTRRLDQGRCVGECPQCQREWNECDCLWGEAG